MWGGGAGNHSGLPWSHRAFGGTAARMWRVARWKSGLTFTGGGPTVWHDRQGLFDGRGRPSENATSLHCVLEF